jgi:hypothetical protein
VPDASVFSRAFARFARSELPSRVHAALIKRTHQDRLVGHISRDATAIEAREKPVKLAVPPQPKRQRGRVRKGCGVAERLLSCSVMAVVGPPVGLLARGRSPIASCHIGAL